MQPLGKRRDPADSFPMLAFLRMVGPPFEKSLFSTDFGGTYMV
jgi:hypothetical protein